MSTQPVKPIPASYRRITPCLVVEGAAQAIDFYSAVFDEEMGRRMAALYA